MVGNNWGGGGNGREGRRERVWIQMHYTNKVNTKYKTRTTSKELGGGGRGIGAMI